MSWLSKQLKSAGKIVKNPVKWAENAGRTVGKAARQAAPVVGLIPGVGTVAGAAIGGLGSVLSGANMKSHLKSGISGGLSGYANTKLLGGQGYKGILSRVPGMGAGTSAMPSTAAAGNTAVSAVPAGAAGAGGLAPEVVAGLSSSAPTSLLGRAASIGSGALGFAEKHPNAMAGAFSALGGLGGNGREDRLMDAQSERIEQETGESSYDFEKRKQREQQLAEIFGQLGIQTEGFRDVAPNPYAMAS